MRKYRTILLLILFTGSYDMVLSQTSEVDSLLTVIKGAPDDTNKVNSLIDLSVLLRKIRDPNHLM